MRRWSVVEETDGDLRFRGVRSASALLGLLRDGHRSEDDARIARTGLSGMLVSREYGDSGGRFSLNFCLGLTAASSGLWNYADLRLPGDGAELGTASRLRHLVERFVRSLQPGFVSVMPTELYGKDGNWFVVHAGWMIWIRDATPADAFAHAVRITELEGGALFESCAGDFDVANSSHVSGAVGLQAELVAAGWVPAPERR